MRNNDRINDFAKKFNESQSEYKVTPVFKGSYPEAMAAAIAAYRAGSAPAILQVLEVGTAHDDVRKGGDQAGLPGDGRCRREIRPEDLHTGGGRVLHQYQGTDAVVSVQQLDDGVLLQQGGVREGRARSQPRAGDLARSHGRRREDQGGGRRVVRLHDRVAVVGPARKLLGVAQHGVRDQGERLRRQRPEARLQRPAAGEAHRQHAGMVEEGLFHVRRPQDRAGGEVLQRRVRDADDVVGCLRQHQAERQIQVRGRAAAVLRGRRRAPRRTRSSAARRCG